MRFDTSATMEAFARLSQAGRGDSARGRNLQALFLLDVCWGNTHLPLASYRPRRSPAAFLAMVFDLAGEFRQRAQPSPVGGHARDGLTVSFETFLADLARDAPSLAHELDPLLRAALLDPKCSTLPSFLARLPLYLRPEELALVDEDRVVAGLTMAEVFEHLGYEPPQPGPGSERHPMGRDLRKAFRVQLDTAWAHALASVEASAIALVACFPLNMSQLAVKLPMPLSEFAFLYALATDGPAPGRRWRPATAFLGAEAARPHFEALVRDPETPLVRLGLSGTLPRTVARLDAWLEQDQEFRRLHAGEDWHAWLRDHEDQIELTRLEFLARLGEVAS